MASVGATSKRVGGKSSGKNASFKKDGYAGPGPHESMVGAKKGLTRGNEATGYSGPPVAQGKH